MRTLPISSAASKTQNFLSSTRSTTPFPSGPLSRRQYCMTGFFSTNHPNVLDAEVVKGVKCTHPPLVLMQGPSLQLPDDPSQLEPCRSGNSPRPIIIILMATATAAAVIHEAPPRNKAPSRALRINLPRFILSSVTLHYGAPSGSFYRWQSGLGSVNDLV